MFLSIYWKVRKVFKPPKFSFYIGRWKNDPNLPVWRRGNIIGSYELPLWFSFYVFNCDIMYKVKWEEDDYRYEFPGHFTIVFFGLSFSITAEERGYFYWESVLAYIHYKGDIKKACDCVGLWNRVKENNRFFGFNAEYIRDNNIRNELINYQNEVLHNNTRV